MKKAARVVLVFLLIVLASRYGWPQEKVDLEMVTRIRYEGFRNPRSWSLPAV